MADENDGRGGPPGYPPFPGNWPDERPRKSEAWKIWVGIAVTIPALMAAAAIAGASSMVDPSGAVAGVIGLACLVAPMVMLLFDATRRFALGLLIGYAVLFILLAGVCVALLASYS